MPRGDRILSDGPSALCDAELVRTLLGTPDELVPARLLAKGIGALGRATPGELLFTAGLTSLHVVRLLAAFELGRRVVLTPPTDRPRLLRPEELASVLWSRLVALPHEEFWVILLNARLQEIHSHRVAQGGITQCSVSPREAFAPALIMQAASVVFAHNHPSGDPSPSGEDQRLQLLLDEAGHTLGVRVIDHLVIAESGFHSAVHGRLPPVSLVPREGVG
ncbi:MAG: JAB domain-containing protein [Myxococcales bacterium]